MKKFIIQLIALIFGVALVSGIIKLAFIVAGIAVPYLTIAIFVYAIRVLSNFLKINLHEMTDEALIKAEINVQKK